MCLEWEKLFWVKHQIILEIKQTTKAFARPYTMLPYMKIMFENFRLGCADKVCLCIRMQASSTFIPRRKLHFSFKNKTRNKKKQSHNAAVDFNVTIFYFSIFAIFHSFVCDKKSWAALNYFSRNFNENYFYFQQICEWHAFQIFKCY